eukprot:scaffold11144_cov111-Isochrysis_galbana.AAC.8
MVGASQLLDLALPVPLLTYELVDLVVEIAHAVLIQPLVLDERHLLRQLLDDLTASERQAGEPRLAPASLARQAQQVTRGWAHSSQSPTSSHSLAKYGRCDLSGRFASRFAVTNRLSRAWAFSSLRAITKPRATPKTKSVCRCPKLTAPYNTTDCGHTTDPRPPCPRRSDHAAPLNQGQVCRCRRSIRTVCHKPPAPLPQLRLSTTTPSPGFFKFHLKSRLIR